MGLQVDHEEIRTGTDHPAEAAEGRFWYGLVKTDGWYHSAGFERPRFKYTDL
jgi:hypothetical protein